MRGASCPEPKTGSAAGMATLRILQARASLSGLLLALVVSPAARNAWALCTLSSTEVRDDQEAVVQQDRARESAEGAL